MRPIVCLLVFAVATIVLACNPSRESKGLFEDQGPLSEQEREEVAELIEQLATAKDLTDPDDEAAYRDAVQDLTLRGSGIEFLLIEALTEHEDWGVRYGVIHVLDSVGTRSCVEPLIATLADPSYLVGYKAMQTLRVFTEHREIPEEGTAANGLSAVPPADPEDLDSESRFKPWIRWHRDHAADLRDAWLRWWKAEGAGVVIE